MYYRSSILIDKKICNMSCIQYLVNLYFILSSGRFSSFRSLSCITFKQFACYFLWLFHNFHFLNWLKLIISNLRRTWKEKLVFRHNITFFQLWGAENMLKNIIIRLQKLTFLVSKRQISFKIMFVYDQVIKI